MQFKKFRSDKGDIRLSSTSGHMALLSQEFISIPDVLWAEAYTLGAIAEDMKVDGMEEFVQSKLEEQRVKEEEERSELKTILKTVFDNPVGFLDSKNNLVVRKIVGLVGKPVKKDLIDSVWEELVAESEG